MKTKVKTDIGGGATCKPIIQIVILQISTASDMKLKLKPAFASERWRQTIF